MKTKTIEQQAQADSDDMLPEYHLTGKHGLRGKYYQAYQQGHTVRIYEDDGSVQVRYFTLEDGAVMLEPDVRAYFPDSDSVNNALRSLIRLIPSKPPERRVNGRQRKQRVG